MWTAAKTGPVTGLTNGIGVRIAPGAPAGRLHRLAHRDGRGQGPYSAAGLPHTGGSTAPTCCVMRA